MHNQKYGLQSTCLTIYHLDSKSCYYASDSHSFYVMIKIMLGQVLCKRICKPTWSPLWNDPLSDVDLFYGIDPNSSADQDWSSLRPTSRRRGDLSYNPIFALSLVPHQWRRLGPHQGQLWEGGQPRSWHPCWVLCPLVTSSCLDHFPFTFPCGDLYACHDIPLMVLSSTWWCWLDPMIKSECNPF